MNTSSQSLVERYSVPSHKKTTEIESSCVKLAEPNQPLLDILLELSSGLVYSFPYSYRVAVRFDPVEGIKLLFSEYEVTIEGKNLNTLAQWLHERRVKSIKTVDTSGTTDDDMPVVNKIVVLERN